MRTTNSPKYMVNAATNDSLPHVGFNIFGMTDQMAGTNFSTTFPQPTSVFMVFDSTAAAAENTYDFFVDNCNVPGTATLPQDGYKTSANQTMDAGGTAIFNAITNFGGVLRIYEFYFNGASSYIASNGVQTITGNPGSNGRKGIAIAGPRNWDLTLIAPMNFYYALFCTNSIDSFSRSNILYKIARKYGIKEVTYP